MSLYLQASMDLTKKTYIPVGLKVPRNSKSIEEARQAKTDRVQARKLEKMIDKFESTLSQISTLDGSLQADMNSNRGNVVVVDHKISRNKYDAELDFEAKSHGTEQEITEAKLVKNGTEVFSFEKKRNKVTLSMLDEQTGEQYIISGTVGYRAEVTINKPDA